MSNEVTIQTQFKRGDIVTLRAMADNLECGTPLRLVVHFWQAGSMWDDDAKPVAESIRYWCRVLTLEKGWSIDGAQSLLGGAQLATGEYLFHEYELELYVATE